MSWYSALMASRPASLVWATAAGADGKASKTRPSAAAATIRICLRFNTSTYNLWGAIVLYGNGIEEEHGRGHEIQRQQQDAFQPVRLSIEGDVGRNRRGETEHQQL